MTKYPDKVLVLEPDDVPFDLNDISDEDRRDLEEFDTMFELMDQEKAWRQSVRKSDSEFVRWFTEENSDFVRRARLRFIREAHRNALETLRLLKEEINRIFLSGTEEEKEMLLPIVQKRAIESSKRAKILAVEKQVLLGKNTDAITTAMIEQARNYPLDQILEVNSRGYALCINHDDKHPSMWTKGNFAHCFSCGYTGDAIDVFMLSHNVGFKEAVKSMTNTPL